MSIKAKIHIRRLPSNLGYFIQGVIPNVEMDQGISLESNPNVNDYTAIAQIKLSRVVDKDGVFSGKSNRLVLEDGFNVVTEFDLQTEKLFNEFYEIRPEYLKSTDHKDELINTAKKIIERGGEPGQIILRELK